MVPPAASLSVDDRALAPALAPAAAGRPESARLSILAAMGRDVVGVWENVLVTHWHAPPSAPQLRRVGEAQARVAARFPDGFVVLVRLPAVAARVGAVARDEAERLAASAPPSMQAIAYVVEGRGFVAASARSVALGVAMAFPHKRPIRTFGGLEPAAGWLATFLDRSLRASAPRKLVEAIRSAIG